ncbi:MAG: hypothetical protein WC655_27105, partial [Candidatus Hydrogenedentales bacterium]
RQVPPYETSPGLKGIFLLSGGKLEPHATLEGIPDAAFSVFEHKSGDIYWIAVIGHGLYEFDMKTLRGTPVAEPEPDAFRNVFQVTAVHDDWYVLAASKAVFNDEIEKPAVLWRLRGGAWQRVLTGLGQLPRCIAQSDEGLWVSAPGEGLWFVPQSGGDPVLVDWRRGLDARGIYHLFPLSGSTVFAIMSRAQWGGRNIMRELRWSDFKNPLQVATNVKEARAFTTPVLDKAGMLWSVRPEEPKSLGAWDGVSWTNYPLPPDVAPLAMRCLAPDDKGRIWLCQCREYKGINYDPANGPVHVFDITSHQWTNHESFPDALVAERAKVGDFQLNEEYAFQPVFGPKQQIAFLENSEDNKIHYFDGSGWHEYDRGIVKTTGRTRSRLEWVYFDNDNRLSVKGHTENNETGEYKDLLMTRNDDDTWTSADGPAPTPMQPPSRMLRERADYPVQKDGEYINYAAAIDARDILWYWYTKDGQLIRGGLGAEAPQFPPGEAHPFRTIENIWRANIDLAGNVWFLANSAREMYVVTPREPAVDTQATVTKENVDTVRIAMAAPNSAEPRYVWRMDGGAWSIPQKDAEVRMARLSGGEHTFEAFAVDEYLTPDATSAIAKFTIDIDTGQQIAGWIEQLSSPDYDVRGNAVKALQQRPEESLKALREARPKAPESAQWWIDVAIQQVEKELKAPAPQP